MGWAHQKNSTVRGANEQALVDPTLDQRMHVVFDSEQYN